MSISQYRSVMISLSQTQLQYSSSTVKLFSHKRWKTLILNAAERLMEKYANHKFLITDLQTIGRAIPEAYLIEATIGIKKFKPQFQQQKPFLEPTTISTLSQTCIKAAKYKKQEKYCDNKYHKTVSMREKNFHREFNKKSHPFRFMIKNIRNLLELKYKNIIDNTSITISEVQSELHKDIDICVQFLSYTSQPYKQLFDNKDQEQKQRLSQNFDKFFKCFASNHPKIQQTVHKIIMYQCRHRYIDLIKQKLPNVSSPQDYSIPNQFMIDGCYIRAMTSLIQFANYNSDMCPKKIMAKLLEFRKNILNDIDQYYLEKQGESRELQLNAEIQIQIIRFIIGKLKDWGVEIYAQLKFLQYIYGEEDIAYKYEEASFMYAQLTMGFQILGFE